MKTCVIDTNLAGDFGKCVICGKEYQIYGRDGFCDDCNIDMEEED